MGCDLSDSKDVIFAEIGARLKAHRLGQGIAPETLAERLGISRAALYRAEKGEIAKIEMLTAIAQELNISLPTLLGVGIEYVPNAVAFFERMRQIEEDCDQIVGLFSPVSYLVTTDDYDRVLRTVLQESLPEDAAQEAARIMPILMERKRKYKLKRPLLASIISDADLVRFMQDGLEGRAGLPPDLIAERRRMAVAEVRHIVDMLREPDIGVQIGVAREPIPSTSFQIVRKAGQATLTVSPFRLGHNPNIRIGVGFITTAPEAIELHEGIAKRLWDSALKGGAAADHLEGLIAQHGPAQ